MRTEKKPLSRQDEYLRFVRPFHNTCLLLTRGATKLVVALSFLFLAAPYVAPLTVRLASGFEVDDISFGLRGPCWPLASSHRCSTHLPKSIGRPYQFS